VADRKFNAIGVVNINSSINALKELSWVEGVGAEDVGSTERSFEQAFYLATPDGFDFDSTGACALFFTQVSDNVRGGDADPRGSEGTCSDAMTDPCVTALVDRAKVDLNGLSGTAACEKLQRDFSGNLDSACTGSARANNWSGITAKGECPALLTDEERHV
jgi:hypothetical protein